MDQNRVVTVNINRLNGSVVANVGISRRQTCHKAYHPELNEFQLALFAAKQITRDFGEPVAAGWLNGSTVVVLYPEK